MNYKISVSNKKWAPHSPCEKKTADIMRKHDISEFLAKLLVNKDITHELAAIYLNPTIKDSLQNPFHLKDMDKAVSRIVQAINNNEKIAIFGDYDVDGATSSALFKLFFKEIGIDIITYIPDRITEGYGPNINALRALKQQNIDLIITVDCGTASVEILNTATNEGLDIIVVDHHLSGDTLPNICAIINPNRFDESSPYTYLAAVGVSFLVIIAINMEMKKNSEYSAPDLMKFLDIVALGTVCDVVPLIGLNRAFVTQGLKIMSSWSNIGLKALATVANIKDTPTTYHLGFILGPRINAGGRVGKADLGTNLLACNNSNQANKIASELNWFNIERKNIEIAVQEEALEQCKTQDDKDVLIVSAEHWHPGVIGIVAGRIKERYNKPVAVIALKNGIGKASCRSIKGFDFGSAIIDAKLKNLVSQGGGHEMAAGFTVDKEKIEQLHDFLNAQYQKVKNIIESQNINYYDAEIVTEQLNHGFYNEIIKLAPFGTSNYEPRFYLQDCYIHKTTIMTEKHLKIVIGNDRFNKMITATAFNVINKPIGNAILHKQKHQNIDIIGYIRNNNFFNRNSIEFYIEDVILEKIT